MSTEHSPRKTKTSSDSDTETFPVMDIKALKHLNLQLAHSAQQVVRDKALDQLIELVS